MEFLSIQQLIDLACTRYGQLVTPIEVYNLGDEACLELLKAVVDEYSYFHPMTKELSIQGSPSGTFLGWDIISVRNVRMNNFYFSKMSPRMDRRQRKFDSHTKMLYVPMYMPIIVECGAKYPVGRMNLSYEVDTVLKGDTYAVFKLENFRHGTLKIKLGQYGWNDTDADYCCESPTVYLDGDDDASDMADVTYNLETGEIKIKDLDELEELGTNPVPIIVNFNTDSPVVQGLELRDKLFIDLFIGRLMLALGNIKATLVMEGDVVNFNGDDLLTQGQALVDKTLELLMSSSTTYKVI